MISARYLWRKRRLQLLGGGAIMVWTLSVASVFAIWDLSHELAVAGLAILWLMGVGGVAFGVRRMDRQIAKRERASARIIYLANHDALTHLPNRHLFLDMLNRAVVRAGNDGSRMALLLIDLDDFKVVNGIVGHAAADEALREVARRLVAVVREGDEVARIDGNEFAVILGDLSDAHVVARVANEILKSIAVPMELLGDYLMMEASMGIAFFPDDANGPEDLVRAAEGAMREVKGLEKAGFTFAGAGRAAVVNHPSRQEERASLYG